MITLIAAVVMGIITLLSMGIMVWASIKRDATTEDWLGVFAVLAFLWLGVIIIGMAEKQYMSFVRWGY